MKSKLKVFGVAAFAIALCFALVGCGGGDKADPKKAVIGTWEALRGSRALPKTIWP